MSIAIATEDPRTLEEAIARAKLAAGVDSAKIAKAACILKGLKAKKPDRVGKVIQNCSETQTDGDITGLRTTYKLPELGTLEDFMGLPAPGVEHSPAYTAQELIADMMESVSVPRNKREWDSMCAPRRGSFVSRRDKGSRLGSRRSSLTDLCSRRSSLNDIGSIWSSVNETGSRRSSLNSEIGDY